MAFSKRVFKQICWQLAPFLLFLWGVCSSRENPAACGDMLKSETLNHCIGEDKTKLSWFIPETALEMNPMGQRGEGPGVILLCVKIASWLQLTKTLLLLPGEWRCSPLTTFLFCLSPDFQDETFTLYIRIKINHSQINEELIQDLSLLPKPGSDNWRGCCCISPWFCSCFYAVKWFIVLRWCTEFIFLKTLLLVGFFFFQLIDLSAMCI